MENNFAQNVLEYNFRHSSARIISITCEIKHGIILFKKSRTSNRIEFSCQAFIHCSCALFIRKRTLKDCIIT